MKLGEILFIIVPYDKNFSKITYNSLKRHPELSLIQTYGFYIFNDENKDEWNVYDNKYLNILHICEKYKKYYDMAIILSGNIFFSTDDIFPFVKLIEKYSVIMERKKVLIAGTPYFEDVKSDIEYFSQINEVNLHGNIFKNKVNKIIDLDFSFINLNLLCDFISPLAFSEKFKTYNINEHTLINNIMFKYSLLIEENIFLKKNTKNSSNIKKITRHFNDYFIYKFTDDYFPLKQLTDSNLNLNSYNYYIFNRFYDEFKKNDESLFSEKFNLDVEESFIKTAFIDVLKNTIDEKK